METSQSQEVSAEKDPGQNAQAAPTVRTKGTPGEALVRALRSRHERRLEKLVHPRNDRIWIKREDNQLSLSMRRLNDEWPLSRQAWLDLANLVGIPSSLLEKLARLPKNEDCRLVNALLWDRGSEADGHLRVLAVDNIVMRISQPDYRSLSAERLAGTLASLESKNAVRVIRWDLTDLGWWIVVGFPNVAAFDLSAGKQGDPDLWEATALLFNQEDGKTAAAVVPGLCRNWGRLWMPVAQGHVRRHEGDGDVLMDVVRALHQAESTDFSKASACLEQLQATRINEGDEWLARLSAPWNESQRQAVKAGFLGGRPSAYRFVAAALRVAYTIEDPVKKLAMLRVLGQVASACKPEETKRGK